MNKKGFTLVEVIAVVAILALLAVIAVPNVVKLFNSGKNDTMTIQENQVLDAANLFLEDYCRNPMDSEHSSYCKSKTNVLFTYGQLCSYRREFENEYCDENTITASDGTLIKRLVNNTLSTPFPGYLFERTDVDLDGKTSVNDGVYLEKNFLYTDKLPQKVYFCINTIKEKGYLKDDILYAGKRNCDGFVEFTKLNRTYSSGKTFLYCGDGEYITPEYKEYKDSNEDYNKNRIKAFNGCGINEL